MDPAILELPAGAYRSMRAHLLPRGARDEEAAFLFAHAEDAGAFRFVDWYGVPGSGFLHRSAYSIELTEEARAFAIKRAHDLGASLVELHSHPFQRVSEFSWSDREGLREFVPHVRWRLRRRPYGAVVVAPTTFDGLAWFDDDTAPRPLAIRLDGAEVVMPTGRSVGSWEAGDGA